MVCDYAVLKALVVDLVQRLDHAMAVSSEDPQLAAIQALGERLVLFERQDPTTEVVARWLYAEIAARLVAGRECRQRRRVPVPAGLELERVRVWEPPPPGPSTGLE
jgi:6-pyruvoyltetrahydropterin/6-carboxytetrahydropterin synthase